MSEPLQCRDFKADDDPPEWRCCGICHYENIFHDDVRCTFLLKDGRRAELCCGLVRKLIATGLLMPDEAAAHGFYVPPAPEKDPQA